MPRGKRLKSSTRETVCNVYKYLEHESKQSRCVSPKLSMKTAGQPLRTVQRRGDWMEQPLSAQYKKRIIVDDFDVEAIRRTFYNFFEHKEFPTLDKLLTY